MKSGVIVISLSDLIGWGVGVLTLIGAGIFLFIMWLKERRKDV